MSYNLVDSNFEDNYTNLLEGIVFIENQYPYYDKDKLEDTYSNSKYSIQMIQNSLNGILEIDEFYKIVIFDILIGNSDRHHSNWAILAKGTVYKTPEDMFDIFFNYSMSPLYDNGSSLCAYEDNNNLEIFFKDKMKFEALVNTKSKSAIGWENKRPIGHFELLKKIKDNSYDRTIQYIENIKNNINEENIDKILSNFDNNIISIDMKKLLKMYLLENVKEAQKSGFKLLIAFPQINALYDNPKLFATFAARLPEPTRPEIKEILETYGMTEYDAFELLKRSGAKLPTDNYEFVK